MGQNVAARGAERRSEHAGAERRSEHAGGGTSLFKRAPKASRFNNLAELGMMKIGEHSRELGQPHHERKHRMKNA
jgi:hypothetical protein